LLKFSLSEWIARVKREHLLQQVIADIRKLEKLRRSTELQCITFLKSSTAPDRLLRAARAFPRLIEEVKIITFIASMMRRDPA
jgi:hypothetical protein